MTLEEVSATYKDQCSIISEKYLSKHNIQSGSAKTANILEQNGIGCGRPFFYSYREVETFT